MKIRLLNASEFAGEKTLLSVAIALGKKAAARVRKLSAEYAGAEILARPTRTGSEVLITREPALWLKAAPTASTVTETTDPETGITTRNTVVAGDIAYTKKGRALPYRSVTTTRLNGATVIDAVLHRERYERTTFPTLDGLPRVHRRVLDRPTVVSAGTTYTMQESVEGRAATSKTSTTFALSGSVDVRRRNGVDVVRRRWQSAASTHHDELVIGGVTIYSATGSTSSVGGISAHLHPGGGWSTLTSNEEFLAVVDSHFLLPESVLLLSAYESAGQGTEGRVQRHVARWYGYDGVLIGAQSFDVTLTSHVGDPVSLAYDGVFAEVSARGSVLSGGDTSMVRYRLLLSAYGVSGVSTVTIRPGATWPTENTFEHPDGDGNLSSVFGAAAQGYLQFLDGGSAWTLGFEGGASALLADGEGAGGPIAVAWGGEDYLLCSTAPTPFGSPDRTAVLSTGGLSYLPYVAPATTVSEFLAFARTADELVLKFSDGVFLSFAAGAVSVLADHSAATRKKIWCASPLGVFVLTEGGLYLNGSLLWNPSVVNALVAAAGETNVLMQQVGGSSSGDAVLQVGFKSGSRGVWEIARVDGVVVETQLVAGVNITASAAGADTMLSGEQGHIDRRFIDGFDFTGKPWK